MNERNTMLIAGGLALSVGLAVALPGPRAWADDPQAEVPEKGRPVQVGQQAPDFTLTAMDGNARTLKDYRGKTVVLEWFDADSPYVAKHHKGQVKEVRGEFTDLVWLGIASGESADIERLNDAIDVWQVDFPVLLDTTGQVARRYGVSHAPHAFVIDEEGVVRYEGAMTDDASENTPGQSYVQRALRALKKGEEVEPKSTFAYGKRLKLPDLD